MHDHTPDFSYRRIFCAVFTLSLSVFSLLFIVLFVVSSPEKLSAEDVHQADTVAFVPSTEETLSVLFIGVRSAQTEAPLFLLAGFYPDRGSVPIVCFPSSTAVQDNAHAKTLAEAWQYGGAQLVRNTLQDILGIQIDRYVCLDAAAFTTAAAAIGSVEITLEQPVVLLRNGAEMTLQPGTHRLSGQNLLDLLHAESDPIARCTFAAAAAAELVNQHMDLCLSDTVDNVFFTIINAVDTDITYNDYDMRKQAATFLVRLKDSPARAITFQGRQGGGGRYYPDTAFTAELGKWFG